MSARDWADEKAEALLELRDPHMDGSHAAAIITGFMPPRVHLGRLSADRGFDARTAIAAALRSARADTIEEAAKAAESEYRITGLPGKCGAQIARRIRALLTPDASGKGAG